MGSWRDWQNCHHFWGAFLVLGLLAGCTPPTQERVTFPNEDDVRAEAFQAGVRAALESYATQYLDNDFPYYRWQAPLMQQTWIPPQISGGVLIPGHTEYVTIKPGAYKREFAAPLSSQRSLMDKRPYVREHPPGWAEATPTMPRTGTTVPSVASPAATTRPPAVRSGVSGESQRPWAALPPPGARWLTDK